MRMVRPVRGRLARVNLSLVHAAFVTQKHRNERVILAFYPMHFGTRATQTNLQRLLKAVVDKAGENPVNGA